MDGKTKETMGCLGACVGAFLVVGLLAESCSGPSRPPMSDSELSSRITKMKADRRQKCIDTIREGMHLWPKEMQKHAAGAMAKCGDDD